MSDPMNDRPTMSREPDGTDDLLPREWFKHMRVMTPEERERFRTAEFPRADVAETEESA